jgi:branched-chain amino acid transport system ATP-binding protein
LILETQDLRSGYEFLDVLHGVSVQVAEGEFVALLGPNGAGKSTFLRTLAGLLSPRAGNVVFSGADIAGWPAHRISRAGLSLVSEDLNLFTGMTVRENLLLGGYGRPNGRKRQESLDTILDLFPQLADRFSNLAGTLSGGERKMLALGRALMANPALLLVDEPSLGLAPKVVTAVFAALESLRATGRTILLVEQNVAAALAIADRAYVLEQGEIVLEGPADVLRENPRIREAYLGLG